MHKTAASRRFAMPAALLAVVLVLSHLAADPAHAETPWSWSEWSELGVNVTDADLANRSDDRLSVIGLTSGRRVLVRHQTPAGTWTGWSQLGRNVSTVSIAGTGTANLAAAVVTGAGRLLVANGSTNNQWGRWVQIGRNVQDAQVARLGRDRLAVATLTKAGRVLVKERAANGIWGPWVQIGLNVDRFDLTRSGSSGLTASVLTKGSRVLTASRTSTTWLPWRQIGENVADLAIAETAPTRPSAAVLTLGGRVLTRQNMGSLWTEWTEVGANASVMSLASTGLLRTAIAVVTTDGRLQFRQETTPSAIDDGAAAAWLRGLLVDAVQAPVEFDGSVENCIAGSASESDTESTRTAVNVFRTMTGLSTIPSFDPVAAGPARAAALLQHANGMLSHTPPPEWNCYTEEGAIASGRSNLAYGFPNGASSIVGYVDDFGCDNWPVGHRRWLLYPRQGSNMAVGSTGVASALIVLGATGPRGSVRTVAWPPAGWVPRDLVFDRWSLAINDEPYNVDFSQATVSVSAGRTSVPVSIIARSTSADPDPCEGGTRSTEYIGDDTIVFEPDLAQLGIRPGMPATDVIVSVVGIRVAGRPVSVTYPVRIFEPT